MPNITNVVVLMLENRSYDNVLGALYSNSIAPAGQWSLNGLTGNETNPIPGSNGGTFSVHANTQPVTIGGAGPGYPASAVPLIDPGEPFDQMAQQYLSLPAVPTSNPYTSYNPNASGLMQGFVANYGAQPSLPAANLQDVMSYLTPEQLPVTAFLAQNFGVCDEWFASAPTQTFTNRAFSLLGGPAIAKFFDDHFSLIDDKQFIDPTRKPTTSIFEQLDNVYGTSGPPNWRVYFHDYPLAAVVDLYTAGKTISDTNNKVTTFDTTDYGGSKPFFLGNLPSGTFLTDVQSGLPMLSLIEPRYNMTSSTFSGLAGGLLPNCDHPGFGNIPFPVEMETSAALNVPIDAASGELLLLRVYNLLQASPNWATTLFIVTFDEAGGTFDHVAPPVATPPGSNFPPASYEDDPAADGFNWNVFGGRVPAIVISPLIAQGSTVRAATPFDHTSIIRTVWEAFGLTQGTTTSLSARDAAAPSLLPFCTASNTTGPFSGTIVCAPSALVFLGTGTLMLYASAGTTELSAAPENQPSWVTTFNTAWDTSTSQLVVTVGVTAGKTSEVLTWSFQITGSGLTAATVNVTLGVS